MFGKTIDYWLLRPLAHKKKRMTAEELDRAAEADVDVDIDRAKRRLAKWNRRLDQRIPLRDDLRYLDIGCGTGGLPLAIALESGGHVTGIDVMPRQCSVASNHAKKLGISDRTEFVPGDVHDLDESAKYDVLLSHEMIEHVRDPQDFFKSVGRLLKPDGRFVVAFGPLFHSPWGDHLNFFYVPIPWRGAIFSEQALLRLRTECFRPSDPVTRYQDMEGGLNTMRYTEFLSYLEESDWEAELMYVNPQFKWCPPLYWLSNQLLKVPIVRDYFAASVYAIFRKAS